MSITLEVICEGVDLFLGRMFNSLFTSTPSATTSIIPLHGSLAVNGHIWSRPEQMRKDDETTAYQLHALLNSKGSLYHYAPF